MERIDCGQDSVFSSMKRRRMNALAVCLKTARQVTSGRVICVASSGANLILPSERCWDAVLERTANVCVITCNDGKAARPLADAHDVLDGFQRPGKAHVIPSRDKAIHWAIEEAREGDVVVVCGTGHRGWKVGRRVTDDASFAKHELYQRVAATTGSSRSYTRSRGNDA